MKNSKKYFLSIVIILFPILFLISSADYLYNLLLRYRESNPVEEIKTQVINKSESNEVETDNSVSGSEVIPTESVSDTVKENAPKKVIIQSSTSAPTSVSTEKIIEDERIDDALDSSGCDKVKGPTYGSAYYDGPLIDSHYHISPIPEDEEPDEDDEDEDWPVLGTNLTIPDIVCTLKQEETDKVFAFFPVYTDFQKEHVEVARRTMERYPDRFVPFIMPPEEDDSKDGYPTVSAETLTEMLNLAPGLFKGFGEIGLYEREDGAAELPPDSKRLKNIYPVVRENKLAVYFHLGEGQMDSFEKTLRDNRDINFIFHGDQLIPGSNNGYALAPLKKILSRNPNAFYTVDELYGNQWMIKPGKTKKEFLDYLENYEPLLEYDLALWEDIIERFPDQFMWGTDRSDQVLWSHDPRVGQALANYARAFIARLDPAVREKFAYKNAERILDKSVNN